MGVSSYSGLSAADLQYQDHVNPQWSRLLDVLQLKVHYRHCSGVELWTADGRRILDFLSGYCVHNIGHNHPAIIAALKEELDRCGPAMLQSHVPELAGELAAELCCRAGGRLNGGRLNGGRLNGGRLNKVFFCSSGSEGVEAAIKFSRARTGRAGLLSAHGAFHGLTCGALSLMTDPFWREGFGPMLVDVSAVPFGDIQALERQVATRQFAAFFVEPIQGEGGMNIPDPGYLQAAQAACRRHGTLFVLDEVQTAMHRTGPFLAAHHSGVDPDIVVMAKALSGGLVPSGAVLMTDEVYNSVFSSLKRSIVHASTYSENALSMRAGLAALRVLDAETLGLRSKVMGEILRRRLREALAGYEMVKDVRGEGLMNGIEFQAPHKLSLKLAFEAFKAIHPGMFGQVVVMRLFRDYGILTQMCGNNFLVLKAAPPLIVDSEQIEEFVRAIAGVVELMHTSGSFWTEALGLARRVANI